MTGERGCRGGRRGGDEYVWKLKCKEISFYEAGVDFSNAESKTDEILNGMFKNSMISFVTQL